MLSQSLYPTPVAPGPGPGARALGWPAGESAFEEDMAPDWGKSWEASPPGQPAVWPCPPPCPHVSALSPGTGTDPTHRHHWPLPKEFSEILKTRGVLITIN